MDKCGSAMEFLENKNILITGATGFLAKSIFGGENLEGSTKCQETLFTVKSSKRDDSFGTQLIEKCIILIVKVIGKDLFQVLKKMWGGDFDTLISEKVCLVPGEVSLSEMGLKDSNLVAEMKNQVELIVNLAATTKFDERYDVAVGTNTLGVKHVISFAKQCPNLKLLVHISTGERGGLILETPYKLGESLNDIQGLDIATEQRVAEEKFKQLEESGASKEAITSAMKGLGLERAKMYGWPNVYVFTKAMGEMVINDVKNNLPVIIIRPTIVTRPSTVILLDMLQVTVGYATGKLTCFLAGITAIIDLVPADMVVNTIIMAMVAYELKPSNKTIYHVGSSARNSMRYIDFQRFNYQYFTKKPWINKDGDAVKVEKVTVFNNMTSFQKYMNIRYLVFLKGLEFANKVFCHSFQDKYNDMKKKINFVMRLIQLYRPYLFFNTIFDDTNAERLRMDIQKKDRETETFLLDPKEINWEDYFMNIHFPGLVKYVFK
ncbi:fatty acyl-CoA reductase 3-like [Cucurbita pepo subsp. pepo]|uniref:fatty acyl-CoA reductase 3-like n=1 Tax=Cucurbita pepo subsp. pepo TaxID=3664 RepID=UPI000C9D7D4D|nr:fatty acyl-CoA reductase 3-like [Cucurbita pepo subsp. pepo]